MILVSATYVPKFNVICIVQMALKLIKMDVTDVSALNLNQNPNVLSFHVQKHVSMASKRTEMDAIVASAMNVPNFTAVSIVQMVLKVIPKDVKSVDAFNHNWNQKLNQNVLQFLVKKLVGMVRKRT